MPNEKRKEALDRRARQYAAARVEYVGFSESNMSEFANAYQRGYRDAMKDIRKELAPLRNCRSENDRLYRIALRILKFLRPLR